MQNLQALDCLDLKVKLVRSSELTVTFCAAREKEETSPEWQNTAVAARGHRHEASHGHGRVAGVVEFLEGETEMVRRKERYIVTRSATCGVADFWKGKLKVEERFS